MSMVNNLRNIHDKFVQQYVFALIGEKISSRWALKGSANLTDQLFSEFLSKILFFTVKVERICLIIKLQS